MPLQYLLRQLALKNATGGGGNLSSTHKHICATAVGDCLSYASSNHATQKCYSSSETTRNHTCDIHVTAYWKTFRLPMPKPTRAAMQGGLAHSQRHTCEPSAGEPATAQPPNIAHQAIPGSHLTKHRMTLKKGSRPFTESTNTHDR